MESIQSDIAQLNALHRRLVHLCARLTGDPDAAEDLAQETLTEAWRLRWKLRDESARFPWAAAIARNLCLRWLRQRGRERARFASVGLDNATEGELDRVADPDDFTVEPERHELAALLDRALAILPPATARLLIERYIEESPHAEIAARLGVSPDAITMRLARGRLQLRRLLDGEMRDEAAAFDSGTRMFSGWRETRIWCPGCGRRRLHGRFERPDGLLAFRCPECCPAPEDLLVAFGLDNPRYARLLAGVSQFKAAYVRTLGYIHDYYRGRLAEASVDCASCGRSVTLIRSLGASAAAPVGPWPRLTTRCLSCGEAGSTSLGGLVHALPAVRRFWREHPRMRVLPPRAVEAAGRPAFLVQVASVTDGACLDVICDRDTLAVLAIHGTGTTPDAPDERR